MHKILFPLPPPRLRAAEIITVELWSRGEDSPRLVVRLLLRNFVMSVVEKGDDDKY
jgi:hypothetical protein